MKFNFLRDLRYIRAAPPVNQFVPPLVACVCRAARPAGINTGDVSRLGIHLKMAGKTEFREQKFLATAAASSAKVGLYPPLGVSV
jgi:hypothetical protein